MRAYTYVDGFNLYYRALKNTPYKWINLAALAKRLLDPADTVERVRYFTARVSANLATPMHLAANKFFSTPLRRSQALHSTMGDSSPKPKCDHW